MANKNPKPRNQRPGYGAFGHRGITDPNAHQARCRDVPLAPMNTLTVVDVGAGPSPVKNEVTQLVLGDLLVPLEPGTMYRYVRLGPGQLLPVLGIERHAVNAPVSRIGVLVASTSFGGVHPGDVLRLMP